MDKKTTLSSIIVLVLAVAAGVAYLYYSAPSVELPPAATPDNSVIAGPVTSISATSIAVVTPPPTTATLAVVADTSVVASSGGASVQKSLSDIKVGMMVLISPAADGSAGFIIIVGAPPAPPAQ
jgi:hypothetical protein